MAYKIVYGHRAVESLANIESYLRERSVSGAKNVLADIKSSIELLAEFPYLGVAIKDLSLRFQVTAKYKYRVIYRATESKI